MCIMAICTLHVPGWIHQVFRGIMDAGGGGNRVYAGFVEFRLNIGGGDIAVVAGIAVLFLGIKTEQAFAGTGIVRGVAVPARIPRNRGFGREGPWVGGLSIPDGGGIAVARSAPVPLVVADQAKGRAGIVGYQKLSELVVVGVVARGALHHPGVVELDRRVEDGGIKQLPVLGG